MTDESPTFLPGLPLDDALGLLDRPLDLVADGGLVLGRARLLRHAARGGLLGCWFLGVGGGSLALARARGALAARRLGRDGGELARAAVARGGAGGRHLLLFGLVLVGSAERLCF